MFAVTSIKLSFSRFALGDNVYRPLFLLPEDVKFEFIEYKVYLYLYL